MVPAQITSVLLKVALRCHWNSQDCFVKCKINKAKGVVTTFCCARHIGAATANGGIFQAEIEANLIQFTYVPVVGNRRSNSHPASSLQLRVERPSRHVCILEVLFWGVQNEGLHQLATTPSCQLENHSPSVADCALNAALRIVNRPQIIDFQPTNNRVGFQPKKFSQVESGR